MSILTEERVKASVDFNFSMEILHKKVSLTIMSRNKTKQESFTTSVLILDYAFVLESFRELQIFVIMLLHTCSFLVSIVEAMRY